MDKIDKLTAVINQFKQIIEEEELSQKEALQIFGYLIKDYSPELLKAFEEVIKNCQET